MTLPSIDLDARELCAFHDRALREREASKGDATGRLDEGLWRWIARNHLCNTLLWDQENRARRRDLPDSEIVRCNRAIDRCNQARNDAVESIDVCLMAVLRQSQAGLHGRLHSETPGAMIDRLSVLSLKIHHMRAQCEREEAGEDHMRACTAKLERLVAQRSDLRDCLDALLADLVAGRACFRLYRQFKMHNDPALNPWLYGTPGMTKAARRAPGIPG